jgi:hypothetical protein
MDLANDLMDTATDLCRQAALCFALRRGIRWAFLIDQAAELLAERARRLGARAGDITQAMGTLQ